MTMKRIALRPTTILTVIITYKLHGLTLEHVIDCGQRLILMTPTKLNLTVFTALLT